MPEFTTKCVFHGIEHKHQRVGTFILTEPCPKCVETAHYRGELKGHNFEINRFQKRVRELLVDLTERGPKNDV